MYVLTVLLFYRHCETEKCFKNGEQNPQAHDDKEGSFKSEE